MIVKPIIPRPKPKKAIAVKNVAIKDKKITTQDIVDGTVKKRR